MAAFALYPCLTGVWQAGQALGLLSSCLTLGCTGCAVLATLRRQSFGSGSLNLWDEALAFLALSRLVHFAHGPA